MEKNYIFTLEENTWQNSVQTHCSENHNSQREEGGDRGIGKAEEQNRVPWAEGWSSAPRSTWRPASWCGVFWERRPHWLSRNHNDWRNAASLARLLAGWLVGWWSVGWLVVCWLLECWSCRHGTTTSRRIEKAPFLFRAQLVSTTAACIEISTYWNFGNFRIMICTVYIIGCEKRKV